MGLLIIQIMNHSAQLSNGNVDADEYYRHQLRIIYRLTFLFVIEERNLVYADSKTPEKKRFMKSISNLISFPIKEIRLRSCLLQKHTDTMIFASTCKYILIV
jgi:hypothetical protein